MFFFFWAFASIFRNWTGQGFWINEGVEGSLYTTGLKALNLRGKDERCQGSTLPGERGYHNLTNARSGCRSEIAWSVVMKFVPFNRRCLECVHRECDVER